MCYLCFVDLLTQMVKKCPGCHSDVKKQRLIQVFFWL